MAPKTTLVHYAFYCSPGGLRAELKTGASPTEADPETGTTALMWLANLHDKHTRTRKRMFRYLVTAGASLTQVDLQGATALDYARKGASRSFRAFVRREYQHILGRASGRTM